MSATLNTHYRRRARHLVVGSGGGLGLAVSNALLKTIEGGAISLLTRDHKTIRSKLNIKTTKDKKTVISIFKFDLNDQVSINKVVQGLGSKAFDYLHIFTGVQGRENRLSLKNIDKNEALNVLWTNAIGIVRFLVQLDRNGLLAKDARLVIFSSAAGSTGLRGTLSHHRPGGNVIYRGSKALLNSLVVNMAYDWSFEASKKNRIVSLVHPGFVATNRASSAASDTPEIFAKQYLTFLAGLRRKHHRRLVSVKFKLLEW